MGVICSTKTKRQQFRLGLNNCRTVAQGRKGQLGPKIKPQNSVTRNMTARTGGFADVLIIQKTMCRAIGIQISNALWVFVFPEMRAVLSALLNQSTVEAHNGDGTCPESAATHDELVAMSASVEPCS